MEAERHRKRDKKKETNRKRDRHTKKERKQGDRWTKI